MSDAYIDAHFDEILAHGSDIEARLDDSGCTIQSLKEDNRAYIARFRAAGEPVTLIESDYERTISALLA